MYYVAFGDGKRNLVVLPGLSDGLTRVKGKAWLLAVPFKRFFHDFTVYMFSRKNDMPEGYSIEDMADDQVTAMKNLGIDRACVLGGVSGRHDSTEHCYKTSGDCRTSDTCCYGSVCK